VFVERILDSPFCACARHPAARSRASRLRLNTVHFFLFTSIVPRLASCRSPVPELCGIGTALSLIMILVPESEHGPLNKDVRVGEMRFLNSPLPLLPTAHYPLLSED